MKAVNKKCYKFLLDMCYAVHKRDYMIKLNSTSINAIAAILDRDNTAEVKRDKSGKVIILEVKKKVINKTE